MSEVTTHTEEKKSGKLSNAWSAAVGAAIGAGGYVFTGGLIGLSVLGAVMAGGGAVAGLMLAGINPAIGTGVGIITGCGVAALGVFATYKLSKAAFNAVSRGVNVQKAPAIIGGIVGVFAAVALSAGINSAVVNHAVDGLDHQPQVSSTLHDSTASKMPMLKSTADLGAKVVVMPAAPSVQ